MISYIKGILTEIEQDLIVVESNNIGYNIRVPASVISRFSTIGTEVKVYTYLAVKEDSLSLYGFVKRDDLNIFKLLINVNGIGPKGALSILSTMSPDDLRFAIVANDAKRIATAPGIGIKTAQKLILELKDRISLEDTLRGEDSADIQGVADIDNTARNEAVEALVALGYGSAEAFRAVNSVDNPSGKDSNILLKEALKKLI